MKDLWTTEEVREALHEILARMINLASEEMQREMSYSKKYLTSFLREAREDLQEEPTNETD